VGGGGGGGSTAGAGGATDLASIIAAQEKAKGTRKVKVVPSVWGLR
jgi:hypothetical protein